MEKRKHRRFKVTLRATATDRTRRRQTVVPCLIRDASISGCKLVSNRIGELPDKICIDVAGLEMPISGTIVWREFPLAGVAFEWDTDTYNRRIEERFNVAIPAQLTDLDQTPVGAGLILDASQSGCRIAMREAPELPDDVYMEITGLTEPIRGEVAWRTKQQAGIKFHWYEDVYQLHEIHFV